MENRIKEKKAYAAPAIVIETVIADTIMCSGDNHDDGHEGCEGGGMGHGMHRDYGKMANHYGKGRGHRGH